MKTQININIDEVTVREGRVINQAKVDRIKNSIEKIGLINPIIIDEDANLIAGNHRLNAYKQLGKKTIPAIITDEKEPNKIKLIEIEENMARGTRFTPAEKCSNVYEMKNAFIALGLFNEGSRPVKGDGKVTNDDIAKMLKLSKATVKLYYAIWSNFTEEERKEIMDRCENFTLEELEILSKVKDSEKRFEKIKNKNEKTKRTRKTKEEMDDEKEKEEESQKNHYEEIIRKLKETIRIRDEEITMLKKMQKSALSSSDKKKLIKLIQPDRFTKALENHKDLLKNLDEATKIANAI